jgi:hypothetical protein
LSEFHGVWMRCGMWGLQAPGVSRNQEGGKILEGHVITLALHALR